MDSSLEFAFADEDRLLDPRVWKAIYVKEPDGNVKKYYSNVITGASTPFLDPDQFRTFTNEEVENLRVRWKNVIKKNKNTLFHSGFAKLTPAQFQSREQQEVNNTNSSPSPTLVVIEADDVNPPEEELAEPQVVALRDTISRNNFERTVGKKKESLVERCEMLGISIVYTSGPKQGRIMSIDEIWIIVDKFFKDLHTEQGSQYISSDCFKADEQEIVRVRQSTTARKRSAARNDHMVNPDIKKRNKNKKVMTKTEVKQYEKDHIYIVEWGTAGKFEVRCKCKNKEFTCPDKYTIESHIEKAQCHLDYVKKQSELQKVDVTLTDESIADAGRIRRLSTVTAADLLFRRRVLFTMLKAGVPIHKCEVMREDIEALSSRSLGPANDLLAEHLNMLLKGEDTLQSMELKPGTICSLVCDGTSRLGEVFNVIVCFIGTNSNNIVVCKQLLIHLGFLQSTLDAGEICGELKKAMQKRRIRTDEVIGLSVDGCAANIRAHKTMENAEEVKWLLLLCLSHMANNAGEQAGFATLKKFWSLLQQIFSHSTSAKQVYKDITGTTWVEYSDTRWYSKHEVYQNLFLKFQFLTTVFSRLMRSNICTKTALEAQEMLLCPRVSLLLKIELAAYVEGLMGFVKFCYNMEADGEIPFKAGAYIDNICETYPDGNLPHTPSLNALVKEAVEFVNDNPEYQRPNVPRPRPRTLRDVVATIERPRRQRAIDAVQNAARAGETEAQRNIREQREVAERVAADERYERELNIAIEQEAELQARFLPQDENEWIVHIQVGLCPAIEYFFDRINDGGDRFFACEIFRAAQLWNPMYAKNIDDETARILLEKLRHVPQLDDDTLIAAIQSSFSKYRTHARTNVIVSPVSILQWHFDFYRRLEDIDSDDNNCGRCRFCHLRFNIQRKCSCVRHLRTWWKVAKVLGVLRPSSGASERLFSILNLNFGDQQTRSLHDIIFASLCFNYNKRSFEQYNFQDLNTNYELDL